MGGVSRATGSINDKMSCNPDAPVYQRGKQIMTVSTFVQEINDLRIAYSTPNAKKCFGHMLPVVRVYRDTPAEINLKIKELKQNSCNRINRIADSSEYEEECEESREDVPKQLQTDGDLPAISTVLAEPCPPSRMSSESEYIGFTSDSESLPDLSEVDDPSYTGRPDRARKEKSPRRSPEKVKEKKKKKVLKGSGHGLGSGELMKAARKNCLQKRKMFVINEKHKRASKEGSELSASSLPPLEQMSEPHVTAPSCRMTGLVQLKPNAKSPRDVERESEKMLPSPKKCTDSNISEEQAKVRMLLKDRLALIPGEIKSKGNTLDGSGKGDIQKRNNLGHSDETVDTEDLTGYDSEETVTYEADNQQQNAEILCESSSPAKRKADFRNGNNKKLRTDPDSSLQLGVVSSPKPLGESVIENDGAEASIMIQNVAGGVHDAFSPPENETGEPATWSSSEDAARLKKLELELQMKEANNEMIIKQIRSLKSAIAEWTAKLNSVEAEKKSVDMAIEELKNQINHIKKSRQSPADNIYDARSPSVVPPSSDASMLAVASRQGAAKGINIISDASISNFGMANTVEGGNSKTTSQMPIHAASQTLARPSDKGPASKKKRKTPSVLLVDPDMPVSIQNSSGGIGPDAIVGVNSQLHHTIPVISGPPFQVSQQQPLTIPHKSSPSYAQAVHRNVSVHQTQFQIQSQLPGQAQTAPVQIGAHFPQQIVTPSHPQFQQLHSKSQPQLLPKSQPTSFNNTLQVPTPLAQQQQSLLQIPSQVQAHQQTQLSHLYIQSQMNPQSQLQNVPQLNTPGMLVPPSLPSESSYVILPHSNQAQQGLLLLPTSGGSNSRIIISSSHAASTVPTSAVQSVTTVNSIAGVVPTTVESSVSVANKPEGNSTFNASDPSRNPILNDILNKGKSYRPGPKSKTRPNRLNEPNVTAKQNPQTSQVSQPCAPLPVSANRGVTALLQENIAGPVTLGTQPAESSQVNKPPGKPHLLVAAQPSIKSAIKSGAAAQAKPQPSLSMVAPYSGLTESEGVKFGLQASQQNTSNATTKSHHDEMGSSISSHRCIDESSSSPEAENSCFLCGSPDTFVCCNNIVYCSTECKEKDWSRHKSECTNNSQMS